MGHGFKEQTGVASMLNHCAIMCHLKSVSLQLYVKVVMVCSVCRDHEEASVGFEEHVLLDHLLEGFPKKGEQMAYYTNMATCI